MSYDEQADILRHKEEVTGLHSLVSHLGWRSSGYKSGLDVGGGDGLHIPWMLEFTDRLIISDIRNYLGQSNGCYASLLKEKFDRYLIACDLNKIEFHFADAHDLPYKNDLFDFIISINAFEHIPDPARALSEMLRVSQPGSLFVIQFDPLWHSPFGHHLWHLGFDPWEHLLVDESAFHEMIREKGGSEQDVSVFIKDMNRRAFSYFETLFTQAFSNFRLHHFNYWAKTQEEEPAMAHPNFEKCLAMGYKRNDLLVRGVQFTGIKK